MFDRRFIAPHSVTGCGRVYFEQMECFGFLSMAWARFRDYGMPRVCLCLLATPAERCLVRAADWQPEAEWVPGQRSVVSDPPRIVRLSEMRMRLMGGGSDDVVEYEDVKMH